MLYILGKLKFLSNRGRYMDADKHPLMLLLFPLLNNFVVVVSHMNMVHKNATCNTNINGNVLIEPSNSSRYQ
jgi:hypothetical protein